ncbi:hypothetical protein HanPSC8_Chr10g0414531 [Helianthus annuus]|nr:hypothetical protein HanPSC8_Chr10g0414531 [Helianthus annuus]
MYFVPRRVLSIHVFQSVGFTGYGCCSSCCSPEFILRDLSQRLQVTFHNSVYKHTRFFLSIPRWYIDNIRLNNHRSVTGRCRVKSSNRPVVSKPVITINNTKTYNMLFII